MINALFNDCTVYTVHAIKKSLYAAKMKAMSEEKHQTESQQVTTILGQKKLGLRKILRHSSRMSAGVFLTVLAKIWIKIFFLGFTVRSARPIAFQQCITLGGLRLVKTK